MSKRRMWGGVCFMKCSACLRKEKELVFIKRLIKLSFQKSEVYTGEEIISILENKGVVFNG